MKRHRPLKYRNKIITIDGIKFRSIKEGNFYLYLKNQKQHKKIKDFQRQPRFIFPCGISYYADFMVTNLNGEITFYDVKGKRTAIYLMKKKMLKKHYPTIDFKEV